MATPSLRPIPSDSRPTWMPVWLSYVLAFVLVVAAAALILLLGGAVIRWATGLGAALLTALTAVVVLVAGRLLDRSRDRAAQLREKKIGTYEALLKVLIGLLLDMPPSEDTHATERHVKKVVDDLGKLTPDLIIWAADPVVAGWSHYRQEGMAAPDRDASMFEFERIVYSIRKDMGHSNSGLKPGDILAFFVNDVKETLVKRPDLARGKISS